uniref:SNRNP25 ubiquitin-like domain-containing protein n=1 Tax=Nelumbo nucifera TaxID=4432 RepID=A0A822ZE89_NELNU|nr:TPA_asm: hypothetical protein HUJ06_016058 [Nelumbo nucifera]
MESCLKGEETGVGYNSSNVKKARLQSTLSALLDDPILTGAPKKPTLSYVWTPLSTWKWLSLLDEDVAVLNCATVKNLKLAITKKTNEMEQLQMGHRHISWRHVWANFCLSHQNQKLIDDNALLQDYCVRNNSQVDYVPFVMSRVCRRHSRRRKHHFFHGLSK